MTELSGDFRSNLYRTLWNRFGDHPDLEDYVQEAMIGAWKAQQKKPEADSTYLWVVGRNAAVQTINRQLTWTTNDVGHQGRAKDPHRTGATFHYDGVPDGDSGYRDRERVLDQMFGQSVEDHYDLGDDWITQLFQQVLTSEEEELVVLKVLLGLPSAEVGAIMGISRSAVNSRWIRVRNRLRNKLQERSAA